MPSCNEGSCKRIVNATYILYFQQRAFYCGRHQHIKITYQSEYIYPSLNADRRQMNIEIQTKKAINTMFESVKSDVEK